MYLRANTWEIPQENRNKKNGRSTKPLSKNASTQQVTCFTTDINYSEKMYQETAVLKLRNTQSPKALHHLQVYDNSCFISMYMNINICTAYVPSKRLDTIAQDTNRIKNKKSKGLHVSVQKNPWIQWTITDNPVHNFWDEHTGLKIEISASWNKIKSSHISWSSWWTARQKTVEQDAKFKQNSIINDHKQKLYEYENSLNGNTRESGKDPTSIYLLIHPAFLKKHFKHMSLHSNINKRTHLMRRKQTTFLLHMPPPPRKPMANHDDGKLGDAFDFRVEKKSVVQKGERDAQSSFCTKTIVFKNVP